ncbi:MAG: ribonuclease E/G [Gemmatimonadales bacterium]
MKREILINGTQRETRVAILEDDRLVELLVDRPDHRRIVGDIFLGRVEAVLPGIQAAFVDIGLEKSAFLHASDLLEPDDDHDPDEEPTTAEHPIVQPEASVSLLEVESVVPDEAESTESTESTEAPDEPAGDSDTPAPGAPAEGGAPRHRRSRRRRRGRGRGNASTGIEGMPSDEGAEPLQPVPPLSDLSVSSAPPSGGGGRPPREGNGRRQREKGGAPQNGRSRERDAAPREREAAPRQREVDHRGAVPNIADLVKKGDTFLVQVSKEPISTKGSRVTKQISLPGRFLVYMPYASRVGVSRKIESREQRGKLREMVTRLLPKGSGGVIVRTVAEGTTEEHFKREIDSLLNLWKKINKKVKFVRAPALVQRETSLTRGIIRDLFSAKVDGVWCDSKELHHEIAQYLEQVDPALIDRVHHYTEAQPLFEKFDIEREIKDLFKPRVELPNGGSIVIQPTEALVSIDVNTGRYTGKKDPEKTILRTNLEAAREIARQIRLRDIGGIIVCDFIDMESKQNRERVVNEIRAHLARDRARTKAYAVSELGLIEMTRQRVRPSLWHSMTADCPTCSGTGRVFRPEVVARRLERSLKRAGYDHRERQLAVRLHPEVALYLLEEEPKLIQLLGRQIGLELEIRDDPMMRLDEFRLMSRPAGRDVTEMYAVA